MGTPVHRIVPDFVIQMGDVENKDGSGGKLYTVAYTHTYTLLLERL